MRCVPRSPAVKPPLDHGHPLVKMAPSALRRVQLALQPRRLRQALHHWNEPLSERATMPVQRLDAVTLQMHALPMNGRLN